MKVTACDLIPAINDENAEVPDYSEPSDSEDEFQPTKRKSVSKAKLDFDSGFKFIDSAKDYSYDSWADVAKYLKRKANHNLDDKIKKARQLGKQNAASGDNKTEDMESDTGSSDSESHNSEKEDMELSDSEFQRDDIKENTKERERKLRKLKKTDSKPPEDFFEEPVIEDTTISFQNMNLSRPLLKGISALNYINPTPIQSSTIPMALAGRDICGCAATGTGKTAAYMLPVLERLLYRPKQSPVTRVLVLVPTRELGVQVYQVTRQLSQFTNVEVGLSVGGLDLQVQEAVLRKNPDIVIATPGRLIDHLKNTPSFCLDTIEILILDEADRMLDEYFADQMKEVIRQCSRTRQTLLFSATMTDEVKDLAAVSLKNPVKIFVDSNKEVAFNLRQEFIRIRPNREGDREALLAALMCRTFKDRALVFFQTKKQAHRMHVLLGLLGLRAGELHGDLSQAQRLEALKRFKNEELDVLLCTDVAARGLDIPGVKTVINFTMPPTLEHYIHRVGRTARAGRGGVSVSLAGESERKIVKEVVKRAKNPVKLRVIPNEILTKYQGKLIKIEPEVHRLLLEEKEEKAMSNLEKQVSKTEVLMKEQKKKKKGIMEVPEQRPRIWFQTTKQRTEEKERLQLTEFEGKKTKRQLKKERNKEGGNAGKQKKTADDRVKREMEKTVAYQARSAKRGMKNKSTRTTPNVNPKKRKKTSFDDELTNTSKKAVKKRRHEATNVLNTKMRQKKSGKKFPSAQNRHKRR